MIRTILAYGFLLAAGSLGLQWLEYRFLVQRHPIEIYVALVALIFMGFGIWVGARLFRRAPAAPFDTHGCRALGISDREREVLELLVAGRTNKEIARRLNVSPNTVKTHVAKLYSKLDVKRRTEAVLRARELGMTP